MKSCFSFAQERLFISTYVVLAFPQEVNEEARDALGPGLSYLEQVCQRWEQIAWLQINNRKLNLEMDVLKDHRDTQVNRVYSLYDHWTTK